MKISAYPVHPVLVIHITDASIESTRRQYEYKMPSLPYTLQKIIIEFSCFESLDIDEHRKAA